MVYISKVYTRFGDGGKTMLASGDTVDKDSARVLAYGDVDELNATIGVLRLEISRENQASPLAASFAQSADRALARIQHELFNLGSELATAGGEMPEGRPHIQQRHVDRIEVEIDELNEKLEPLRSFTLPGGGPAATAAHVSRTVCRRAERRMVGLARSENVRSESMRYINRLSDYLFVFSRASARAFGHPEVLWDPSTT
jgi:cob(I)alamin adenosyltransferase